MTDDQHWRKLERLYTKAPTNEYYQPTIRIAHSLCEIEIAVRQDFFHAAHAVHGSVYFKLLDDAGFFAANSVVREVFVLTTDFTIHLLRPVRSGVLRAKGRIIHAGARQVIAESTLHGDDDKLLAHGVGTFIRSNIELTAEVGYSD